MPPTPANGFARLAALPVVILGGAALGQGGDDAGSAVPLALDAPASGTTVNYTDDSDEICPYTGSTSPDVYYAYVPAADHVLTVDLCESGYDTKTYVYDSALQLLNTTVLFEPACSDDACSSSGGGSFRSRVTCVPVHAGATYFVVVDGWGGDAGAYEIVLQDTLVAKGDPSACADEPPCQVDCTGVEENEPCDEGGPDVTNGGCTTDPPLFSPISCDTTVCGQSYFNGSIRDTDWYRKETLTCEIHRFQVTAEFEAVVGRVQNDGIDDCEGVGAFAQVVVGAFRCEPLSFVTPQLKPGIHWYFVGANFTGSVSCADPDDARYEATLACKLAVNDCSVGTCPWDFNDNGAVDFQDLLQLLSNWGPCPET